MGKWAEGMFGKKEFGSVGLVVGGATKPKEEKTILGMFDKVIQSGDRAYHPHLVSLNGKEYAVMTNVYGGPAMMDSLADMYDGGCYNLLFVGYAYGFKGVKPGDIVIPDRAYHYDGLYHQIIADQEFGEPDTELRALFEKTLKKSGITFLTGRNISVPSVHWQPKHATKNYKKIKPTSLEMELAACLSRARDIGVRAVGALIISDTKSESIIDKNRHRKTSGAKLKVIKSIVESWESFDLPRLAVKKPHSVDEHLASIIHDPDDDTNVYRDG